MPPFLPPEILGMIISWIFDIETLLALRLVNRIWHDAVDYIAEQLLYVDLLSKNLTRLDSVSRRESLRNKVRTLVWNFPDRPIWSSSSVSDPESADEDTSPGRMILGLNPVQVFSKILNMRMLQRGNFLFPNLAHVALHFRPPPIPGIQCLCSPGRKGAYLREVFALTIMGLDGFHGLNELSIVNMPIEFSLPHWITPANVIHWPQVRRVLHAFGLKSLRMSFLGPNIWPFKNDDRTRAPSARTNHLLICTVGETLRHLSLSYWGLYMKDSPGSLARHAHLPHLQSLELRSTGFTTSKTLTWILDHGNTLRSLKFDDCAIVYSMELSPGSKNEALSGEISIGVDGGRVYQMYHSVWARWFQLLANGLPHLQRFEFGSSRVREPGETGPTFKSETLVGPKFGHTSHFLFGLFPDRYLEMKDGTAYSPWVLRPMAKHRKYKDHPLSDQADIWALRQLLAFTGQDVRESDTSNHAAKVVDLMGIVETSE